MVRPSLSRLIVDIERIATELEKVNDGKEITTAYEFDYQQNLLLSQFHASFHDLSLILARDEQRRTPLSTSANTPLFTTPQFTTPTQQVLTEHTVMQDSPHSTESNRSAKLEHHTASFANQFLKATYFSLQTHLTQQAWFNKPRKLGVVYFSFPRLCFINMVLIAERNRRWKLNLAIPKSLLNRMVEFHSIQIPPQHKIIQSFASRYFPSLSDCIFPFCSIAFVGMVLM